MPKGKELVLVGKYDIIPFIKGASVGQVMAMYKKLKKRCYKPSARLINILYTV